MPASTARFARESKSQLIDRIEQLERRLAALGEDEAGRGSTTTSPDDGGILPVGRDVAAFRDQESRRRFQDFAEASSDWFWELDADLVYTDVSNRFEEVTGVAREDIVGRSHADFLRERAPAGERQEIAGRLRSHLADIESRRPFRHVVFPVTRADGGVAHLSLSGRPVFDDRNRLLGFRGSGTDITSEVEADARARTAQSQLALAIENISEMFVLFDAEDRIVISNRTWRELNREVLDHTAPGTRWEDFMRATLARGLVSDAEGREEEWLALRRAHRGKPKGPVEAERADGTWILIHEQVLPDGGICNVVQDITERKRYERALRESEERLRAILDFLPLAVNIKDLDGRYVLVNRQFESWHGVSEAEIAGKLPSEHPDGRNERDAARDAHEQRVIRSRTVATREEVKRTAGGRTYHSLIRKFPIFDADGELAAVGTATTDVSELKRAQAELRRHRDQLERLVEQRTRELRKSEERLRGAVESLEEGFALFDSDDRLVAVNDRITLMNPGAGKTTARNRTFEELLRANVEAGQLPDAVGREEEFIRERLVRHRNPGPDKRTLSFANGRWFEIKETRTPDGGIALTANDVTEQKRAEAALEAAKEQAVERARDLEAAQQELLKKERLATLGQLTTTVSHELRSPLGAMRPALYMLRRRLDPDDSRALRAFERLDRNIERCDRIIDDLLDFTRSRQLKLEPVVIDDWVASIFESQPPPAGVEVRHERGLRDRTIRVDTHRLRRAVVNVYENACQAMAGEDEQGAQSGARIVLTTRRAGGRIEIEVADNGPGIPSDARPRIFEPLFSTRGSGVGLGLPTVKQIMEQHGGGVDVESGESQGTRVVLWLPERDECGAAA